MTSFTHYPPQLRELLVPDFLPPLGPGTPNTESGGKLADLRIDSAFVPQTVRDRDMAACCLAGLWLLHGYLDESHKISMEIETTNGSYWHGVMHRREPDFGNAKYWFRRLPAHPVYPDLQREARELANQTGVKEGEFLTTQRQWDSFKFIDLCQHFLGQGGEGEMLCKRIQRCEWDLLFDYCYRQSCDQ